MALPNSPRARHVPGTGGRHEMRAGDVKRLPGLAAPESPVVTATYDGVVGGDAQPGEGALEPGILCEQVLVDRSRVEPDERMRGLERGCRSRQGDSGAVPTQQRFPLAEDRVDVVGAHVAGPALQHVELARVVQTDVERPVA